MDLKKLQKKKIIENVFRAEKSSDWSVLVYDKAAAKVMTSLFTQSELISYNIVIAQRIEEEREQADFPVVYFVECNKENSNAINEDFNSKKYSSYTVCSLNNPEGLHELIKAKRIFMNFLAVEDRVFLSSIEDIYSVADSLNAQFFVEYTAKDLEKQCEVLDESFSGDNRNGKIIVFDRSIDLYTPILHFFTFQALLVDLDIKIAEEYEDSKLWKDVRHAHLGELNGIFKTYAHDVSANMKKLEGDVDTKELMKMVLSAPETMKTNQMLKEFFGLAERCYESFQYISLFCELEQTIATGINKSKRRVQVDAASVFEILNHKNVEHADKLRLYYLYKFSGYEYQENEKKKLATLGFKEEELEYSQPSFSPLSYEFKYEYDVSRYEPTVSVVLKEYLNNKKKLTQFFRLKRGINPIKSLRKSYLLSVKSELHKKKIYIIYIKGGVTYPEIACIHKLTDLLGIEFLIGSDKILRPKEFLNQLNKM
ncbi:Syntaxin-binding protein 1 [Nosema granulosis]|uniref:Syntaxin-binding protein 1 n=1 Tax=Nosema granulosis TaxID=83296 RepID=A0A9P6H0E5_9MICR|nr:Syntaxin-binding protein 1 [Nosema granulosis]